MISSCTLIESKRWACCIVNVDYQRGLRQLVTAGARLHAHVRVLTSGSLHTLQLSLATPAYQSVHSQLLEENGSGGVLDSQRR